MGTSFDSADWFLGLVLVGGTSTLIMVGALLGGRPFLDLLTAASLFIIGIAAAVGIDLLLQIAISEEFWKSGTHKRGAMRTFLPFGFGLCVGLGVILLLQRWSRR